jgi:tRNA threonylcarbamoyladenosine biosynthesis protein TsaB
MRILAIRTDKPEAELYVFDNVVKLAEYKWQADRQLAETIHLKIKDILDESSIELSDLGGLLAYRGPGSFTGLRIGITVANALAFALQIPITGSLDPDWLDSGVQKLLDGADDKIVKPEYGGEPNISQPKH